MIAFITKFIVWVFNNFLEAKYKLKVLLWHRKEKNEIEIKNIYLIHKESGKIICKDLSDSISKLNYKIKYNHKICLSEYLCDIGIEKNGEYLIEMDYKKYGKDFIFNYEYNERDVLFPFYHIVDLKHKNMNKIMDIEQIGEDDGLNGERLRMLEMYGGPLNDFYSLRGLGIKLGNLYSVKENKFLFRDVELKMEDAFLNEYSIGKEDEDEVLKIKGGLENITLTRDEENEKYILGKYNKFNMDGVMFIKGLYNWIYSSCYRKVWGEKQE